MKFQFQSAWFLTHFLSTKTGNCLAIKNLVDCPQADVINNVVYWEHTKSKQNKRDGKFWARQRNGERCFSSCQEYGAKKKFWVPMRNQTSDLRIPRFDAPPLSHWDSTVSEVFYEVHMKRVLHTARISNVDSVMFVDRNKRDGKFWAR